MTAPGAPTNVYVPRPEPLPMRDQLERWFRGGVFAVLFLVLFVATVRAYFALEYAIVTWFEDRYVPLVQAGFSLLVVALTAWLIREYVIARR